jgi:L-ascorbate metabolism protein UlaG (beta-lactamase superfamily)
MEITYYGHSTFLINTGSHKLLFDPFIRGNHKASHINAKEIEADVILISHAHGDHTDDLVEIATRCNALVIGSYEVTTWAEKKGVQRIHGLNMGGSIKPEFGRLRAVSAVHSSSFNDGTYSGNPLGFVIEAGGKAFYYSGDTALTMDMQLIPRWHKLDFCFLPIGNNYTMGYEDACTAAEFVNCNKVLGMHFDTFPVIEIDHNAAIQHFKHHNKDLVLMKIGETIRL